MNVDITNPAVRQIGDDRYELVEPLCVSYSLEGFVFLQFDVPAGYVTDFASVPRLFWVLFPKQGRYSLAAILHDYLYSQKTVSRFLADALFRDLMHKLKVPICRRVPMYYAVRFFGWLYWRSSK